MIGAGPHGLAAVAHLRVAGVETVNFGEPMAFWERNMPIGMLLRSSRRASSMSDPDRALTLDRYEKARRVQLPDPLTLDSFVAYAHWFRQQAAPDVDRRQIVRVDSAAAGFRLTLDDGESLDVRRVVVAAGISRFAWSPEQFRKLPRSLVSHSSAIREPRGFAGRRVLVVGAGQSALEYAALLHEGGASVEILARAPCIRWLRGEAGDPREGSALGRRARNLLYPPTGVGPPGLNWIAGAPDVFRRMPPIFQPEISRRCTPPAGAPWLIPRLEGVAITTGRSVASAMPVGGRILVTLDDGSRREVDHAVVATGYRVDVRRYEFIGSELLHSLSLADGYPRLSTGLESSIPGLHFLGAPAAFSFGPVMRFVTGSWYSARALTRRIVGKPPLPLTFSW